MASFNPYVNDDGSMNPPVYSMPTGGSYAAPSLESGDAYTDEFGWAPGSIGRASTVEYPSAQRLGSVPRYDMRPDPAKPSDDAFRRQDADDKQRHAVEDVNGQFSSPSGVVAGERRWAPNPRSVPVEESRITSRLAPRTYSFTRPFDQHAARQFNGTHFSMADHRREYEVVGTAPVRTARNTYRMEPTPWDTDIIDLPPDVDYDSTPNGRVRSVEVPQSNRSWRL